MVLVFSLNYSIVATYAGQENNVPWTFRVVALVLHLGSVADVAHY